MTARYPASSPSTIQQPLSGQRAGTAAFHSVVVSVAYLGDGGPVSMESAYWIYGWLQERYRLLHDGDVDLHGSRALAVSPLLHEREAVIAGTLERGRRYTFRLSWLLDAAFVEWRDQLWPTLPEELRLGQSVFRPLDWTEDPAAHPLAASAGADELVRWGREHAGEALTLRFLTPTCFKSLYRPTPEARPLDILVPLPDPARIVSSLAGRWARFVPPEPAWPPELVEALVQTVAINRAEVRTVLSRGKGLGKGFVGWAECRCLAPEAAVQSAFASLWRFAGFSGVGMKTALGMGLVRLETRGRETRAEVPGASGHR